MADETKKAERRTEPEPIPWATFLETTPPNARRAISNLFVKDGTSWMVARTDLQLHCGSERCGGVRSFAWSSDSVYFGAGWQQFFVTYTCRNCQGTGKIFALSAQRPNPPAPNGVAVKFGEIPEFGPPTPARVISLIGPDRELYLRGRRSEIQGLGIGAFGYYRRVVENQKGRLIEEIASVARKLGAKPQAIEALERAATETQFSRAVELVKDAIPPALLIKGHNPLLLLHNALSKGLHELPDEECLPLATSIRVVLADLAERIGSALKDEAELTHAVNKLLNP